MGDLSENFEYHCAKRDNNLNNSRIRYLEKMLRFATVIDDESTEDTIGINNTVDVYFEDDDYTETYRIVTPIRCDSRKGLISNESPLGKSLLGRKVGDRIKIDVDGGDSYFIVIKNLIKTGESDEDTNIFVGANHVSFTVGSTVVISRRLEGDFLNYRKAMPDTFKIHIKVGRGELLKVVDRVALIIDEKTKNPVRMTFNENFIDCLCNTPIGKAEDVCFAEGNGEGLEIGFNGKYLMDALKAAPADELELCLNSNTSPCIMVPCDGSDKFKYMILPIRLRS